MENERTFCKKINISGTGNEKIQLNNNNVLDLVWRNHYYVTLRKTQSLDIYLERVTIYYAHATEGLYTANLIFDQELLAAIDPNFNPEIVLEIKYSIKNKMENVIFDTSTLFPFLKKKKLVTASNEKNKVAEIEPKNSDSFLDEALVARAFKFCYDKNEGIHGYEKQLLVFAKKHSIEGLKNACFKSLMECTISVENISYITSMAFEENFDDLKKKCIHFLKEQKNNIDEKVWNSLPREALIATINLP